MENESLECIRARAKELEEQAEKQAGVAAVAKIVQKHLDHINDLRNRFPLDNVDLLCVNIVDKLVDIKTRGEWIDDAVSAEVSALHERVRVIIEDVAATIENIRYQSSEEAISSMPLSFNERKKANALLSADKERLVSCQSLNIAVEMFSELNQLVKRQIEESERKGEVTRETNLLFGNAVLVYELTDFVIKYIEQFEVQGVGEITKLHAESKRRNAEIIAELEELRSMAQAEGVSQAARDFTLAEIAARSQAIELVDAEWDKYIQHNQKLQQEVDSVIGNLPTLRLIRASSKSQLNVLEAVKVLQIVNNSLVTLQDALKTLENMELVSLSPDRVQRLLGIKGH